MKYVGKVFNVSGNDLGISSSHDVVVLNHNRKNKKCRVKTITSLEHYDRNRHCYRYDYDALKRAKNGDIFPLNKSVLGNEHWSGIDSREINICESTLKERKHSRNDSLPYKYLKIIYK